MTQENKQYRKTWLQESVLLSLILLPFGLAALFYAAKVTPLSISGNIEASEFYARKAKLYVKIGFFTFIALATLTLFLLAITYVWLKIVMPTT